MSADRAGANATVWFLALEKLLFALPALVGLGIAGVLQERGDPTIQSGLVVFAAIGAVALRIGIPICVFLDATRLRSHAWRPNRWAYALAALAVSAPLVGLFYLYRRHDRRGRAQRLPAGGVQGRGPRPGRVRSTVAAQPGDVPGAGVPEPRDHRPPAAGRLLLPVPAPSDGRSSVIRATCPFRRRRQKRVFGRPLIIPGNSKRRH